MTFCQVNFFAQYRGFHSFPKKFGQLKKKNTTLLRTSLPVNPSGTKGFGTHTQHKGGGRKGPTQYLKNDRYYKPETLGGVRGILHRFPKKFGQLKKMNPTLLRTSLPVNPSGTKGFGTHTQHKGGGRKGPTQYLKNDRYYKPETLGGVRGILQGLKKFQVYITAFAW